MKGRLNSEYGQITISSDVIATYAGSVAVGCFGIVGMAAYSVKDGLFHLLKKDSLKYGIKLESKRIKFRLLFTASSLTVSASRLSLKISSKR